MNKRKKIITFLFTCGLVFSSLQVSVFAAELTREDIYTAIGSAIEVPESYQYIDLYYKDISREDEGFVGLQKLVYTGKIPNKYKNVYPHNSISKGELYLFLSKIADKNRSQIEYLKSDISAATDEDINRLNNLFGKTQTTVVVHEKRVTTNIDKTKLRILNDVYDTINMNHYDSDSFSETQLIDSAIEGIAKGTDDMHTSYFPPVENKNFQDSLEGEYEGIGAYVDMPEAGTVIIVSPIAGGPAEATGLRGGDIIYKVNGEAIQKTESLSEVVAKIKGKEGTQVILSVRRDGEELDFSVTRGKITIKEVQGETMESGTYYIQMKMFTGHIAAEFEEELVTLKEQRNIKKIIIDLRNNPGGYLDQVVEILGHFIEKGKPVAVIKYKDSEQIYNSYGYNSYDFSNKKIVLLVNSGTASASEILAGTLKDYYGDQVQIVGEQTYGKGSVQTQKYYTDGSALKYTIAKWYTGKTQQGIDKIGITPDHALMFDVDIWKKNQTDNQLEKAKQIR